MVETLYCKHAPVLYIKTKYTAFKFDIVTELTCYFKNNKIIFKVNVLFTYTLKYVAKFNGCSNQVRY